MSTLENGGPAFPTLKRLENKSIGVQTAVSSQGLSVRDFFAAKAMAIQPWHSLEDSYENHADRCYAIADAMLKARSA